MATRLENLKHGKVSEFKSGQENGTQLRKMCFTVVCYHEYCDGYKINTNVFRASDSVIYFDVARIISLHIIITRLLCWTLI